ncbi:MAG: ribose-5-phosphate isomerase RpiA [Methanomassiliicoccales archaeon]|jgi:ribose 5-phosphate isomerase A|nr:ribose-5-phosphate isomerase RpiA [Methanomassiliicoccales archaeon]MDD1756519.1 ribose-5-phosphate isomerase RpiA [Methanomassiliicoccales archaeon]
MEKKKKAAAEAAIELVKDGMVVGLGTGSTANFAIEGLGKRVGEGLRIRGVATSKATEELARRVGVPVVTLEEVGRLDLTIDGADEVDPQFNLIKGMGGALLREKIVAFASRQEVIIVDDSKLVDVLGTKSPLPVEVVPFGHLRTKDALESLGCKASLKGGSSPFLTDNGNLIYECKFAKIEEPEILEAEIDLIPGVVESGLFIDLATKVVVASGRGIEVRSKR